MAKKSFLLIIAIVLIALGLWVWSGYNGFVIADESVNGAWAQVETSYQRRFDLIPNLVDTVKGAAAFEQETFTGVTEARTKWMNANSRSDQIAAAASFESSLARLLVTVENYPQLQATQAYRDLMAQLEGTENRISVARRDYNETVRSFNVLVRQFPKNILANLFGFEKQDFFESDAEAAKAPDVEF